MELVLPNRVEALAPDGAEVDRIRQLLVPQVLGVHPNHQHLLVIAAVEDADSPPLRQASGGAPEEVVIELLR